MLLNEKGRWTEMLVQSENPWLPVCSLWMVPVFPAQAHSRVGGWWKRANPWLWPWSGSAGQETTQGKTGQGLAPLSWFHILCWACLWWCFTPQVKQHRCTTPTFHHTTASQNHQRSPGLRQAALLGRYQWQQSLNSCWYQPPEQFQKCVPAGMVSLVWSKQDAHGGLTWNTKHKSVPSVSYIIVFQYIRLVWSCVRVKTTVSSQSSSLQT